MEKLKRLQKKLSASGYNAEFITVYNRNGSGENVPALRISQTMKDSTRRKRHTRL